MDIVLPLQFDPAASPGSTDVGDVSYVCPTAQLNMATYAIGTPGHSWQLTAQSGCSIGHGGDAGSGQGYGLCCGLRYEGPGTAAKGEGRIRQGYRR